jgi:lipopolysaccharide export system protein LptA
MRSKSLIVYYDQEAGAKNAKNKKAPSASMKAAMPGPGGSSQIRKLEAKGGVVVKQKDQTVTGETGIFDMKSNTVTLLGGVVLTQGQNVLRGDRLVVNLATGVSRVEVGQGGRVRALINSKSDSKSDGDAKGAPSGGGGEAREAPRGNSREVGKPLRLNAFPPSSRPPG